MSKFLVETYYTCTFKILHELDELNEKVLSDIDSRQDGKVEIIDVTVNNRKTKKAGNNKNVKKIDLQDKARIDHKPTYKKVDAIGEKGDVLLAISTSGNSNNIIEAANTAKKIGCNVVGLTGVGGGKLKSICHINIDVPSANTTRIQEIHILIGHIVCELIENNY